VSSLLFYQGVVYMANEHGIVSGVEARSGATLFRERLSGAFTASPVAGDDKVYLLNEDGETYVLQAGRELKVLSQNRLDERTLASPAISEGELFIRTDESLYCIRN
jgi:outer membrane protein assembly factor BamB